ncbi:helix-turn-helix domain-containing protein [Nocardia sp. NPDC050406]|uniref:MmyB family transcriptional regulator n=1 Tax=Nocardia sp. NPDC050406 TaxID=3364318 RepID=UPI00379CE416
MSKGQLALFVRARRDALRLTQAQLAKTTGWSKSAIEKVEAGTLTPSLEFTGALFDALGIPYMFRERIIAALFPGTLPLILGPYPELPDDDALADLEDLPYPAAYIALPVGDIVGTNSQWNTVFPGLEAKSNLLVYLFTDPRAATLLPDWEQVAHGYAYGLRMLGPISVPENAINEVVRRCRAHPDFERMWTVDPVEPTAVQPMLRVTMPDGEIRNLRIKIDKPHLPRGYWLTYRLVPERD